MAAPNATQIFGKFGKFAWTVAPMTAANTDMTGTSGTVYFLKDFGGSDWTAPSAGTMIFDFVFRPHGTNTNDTVVRVFLNNGDDATVAANNILIHEETLPASNVSQVANSEPVTFALNRVFPEGSRIFFTLGTAPTSAGWRVWMSGMAYE